MNDTAVSIDEQIHAFAAAVRAHLDDLPSDELDEIMSGLTADLTDQAADNDGLIELGDPGIYAEELRSAAGLPPRTESPRRPSLRERFGSWRSGVVDSIRRSPVGAWLLDLLLALRPVWWVLRAFGMWAAGSFLGPLLPPYSYVPYGNWALPTGPLGWGALLGLVVVSVQWGRGRWLPRNVFRHVRTVASILAILVLPSVFSAMFSPQIEYVGDEYVPQGLMLDGVQIQNIFAYDEEGNPIDRVQLFTGKGTPLDLYGAGGGSVMESEEGGEVEVGFQGDGMTVTVPSDDYRGTPVWNIYPLDEADIDTSSYQPDLSTTKRPEPPFAKAPTIDAPTPTPTPSPAVDGVPEPTVTPAP